MGYSAADNNIGTSQTIWFWGDSLTAGAGADIGEDLTSLVRRVLSNRIIINEGIGGQSWEQILARHGSSPTKITLSGNALNNTTAVATTLTTALYSTPADAGDRSHTGTVNNLPISLHRVGATNLYHSKCAGGTSTATILAGSEFIPDIGFSSKCDINIFWCGRNNASPWTGLLPAYEKAVDYLNFPKRFFMIGILPNTSEIVGQTSYNNLIAFNNQLRTAYPDRYIESTPPTTLEMLAIGYTPSSDDLTDITNGIFPRGMKSDTIHLTGSGYKIMANRVIDKIMTFGW